MLTWRSKIPRWFTRQYGRARGGIVDETEYSAYGVSRTVFWYDKETRRAGDFSPFGTILMNRHLPEGIPEEFRDYVFLHEVGHGEVNPVLRLLYLPCILGAFVLAIAGVIVLPVNLLRAILWAPSPETTPAFLGIAVLISIAAMVPLVVLFWVDETIAELYAISHLGQDRYAEIQSQIQENRDPSLRRMIRYSIQYPPTSVILRVARWMGIDIVEAE